MAKRQRVWIGKHTDEKALEREADAVLGSVQARGGTVVSTAYGITAGGPEYRPVFSLCVVYAADAPVERMGEAELEAALADRRQLRTS